MVLTICEDLMYDVSGLGLSAAAVGTTAILSQPC